MLMRDTDHPHVVLPPPLLYAGAFLLLLLFRRLWPLPILDHPSLYWFGVAVLCMGILLNGAGAYTMLKAKTAINPYRPVNRMVATGPFRFSRNPLYVGLDLVFIGVISVLNSLWGLPVLALLLVIMHYGVILREERYLEARFCEPYRRYCATVRRYL